MGFNLHEMLLLVLMLGAWTLEPDSWDWNLGSPIYCITLDKFLKIFVLQFPYLENGEITVPISRILARVELV